MAGFGTTSLGDVGLTGFPPTVKVKEPMLTYAAELECAEKDTRHWMHRWCVEQNNSQLAEIPGILKGTGLKPTVPNVMMMAATNHAKKKCMGYRDIQECIVEGTKTFWRKAPEYTWRTYEEVYVDIQCAGRGLYKLPGIGEMREQKQQVVAALLAETSSEWQIAAQAALACGLTLTTVYATLGHEAMLHGLQQTEAQVIFIDWGLFETLKHVVLAKCPALRHIVFIGKELVPLKTTGGAGQAPFPSPEQVATIPPIEFGASRAICTTLDTLIRVGKSAKDPVNLKAVEPSAEDVAMIMYTSGSTGLPKGVVLTHINFVSVLASTAAQVSMLMIVGLFWLCIRSLLTLMRPQGCILPLATDVVVAYLPLAHILELLVETASLSQGACIGYGHPRTLTAGGAYMKPGFKSDLQVERTTP